MTWLLMDRFYANLAQGMGRGESLREAQRYLRKDVTIGGIRKEWLSDEMIARLTKGDDRARERMEYWRGCPDTYRPFRDPTFWGVFVLHGETAPLQSPIAL